MGKVVLTGEAAVVASRIRTIDRELTQIEDDRPHSLAFGMAASGLAAGAAKLAQEQADVRYAGLLDERAGLVRRLKALVGDDVHRLKTQELETFSVPAWSAGRWCGGRSRGGATRAWAGAVRGAGCGVRC